MVWGAVAMALILLIAGSKLYLPSVFALLGLLLWSQDMLREQPTPKTGRTTQLTSHKRYADSEIIKSWTSLHRSKDPTNAPTAPELRPSLSFTPLHLEQRG